MDFVRKFCSLSDTYENTKDLGLCEWAQIPVEEFEGGS